MKDRRRLALAVSFKCATRKNEPRASTQLVNSAYILGAL